MALGRYIGPTLRVSFISSSLFDPGRHYHVGFGLAASPLVTSPHLI